MAQIATDFLGRIIFFSGPHLGTEYDGHIWRNTADFHPTKDWEWLLGDHHYTEPGLLHGFVSPPNGHLTPSQSLFNAILSHYRARVEHTNARFKRHGVFQTNFRGALTTLTQILHIVAHTTNIDLKTRIKYPPFGPWPHFQ